MAFHEPHTGHGQREMTLGQLMGQVCQLTGDRLRVKMEKIGLHRGQGFVLMHLWHRDGMAQQEIANAKRVSPATVTNMLKRMERDGWIERRRDEKDERVVRVYLTDKAQAMREEAKESFFELDNEIGAALTDDERCTFRTLLCKVHAKLVETSPRGMRRGHGFHMPHGSEGGQQE